MRKTKHIAILLSFLFLTGCASDQSNQAQHASSGQNMMEQVIQQQTAQAGESRTEETVAEEAADASSDSSAETGTLQQPDAAMQNGAIDLEPLPESDVDVDLTKMNATMVYARVLNLMMNPETYVGMTVRMSGKLARYVDPETQAQYFACIIPDATACCSQGIEFVRKGDYRFPEDYPALDENVVVEGVLEIYEENGLKYIHLNNADMRLADDTQPTDG